MIRSRRQLHRNTFTALALIVPGLLAIVFFFRPDVPPVAAIEARLMQQAGFSTTKDWQPHVVSSGAYEFEVQSLTNNVNNSLRLLLRPTKVILKPDLLVYWTSQPLTNQKLAQDAILIGSLSGTSRRELLLPSAATTRQGTIVIYSIAHGEVIAHFP